MHTEFEWVAIAIVSVLSTARITRLATWDALPPAIWLRDKYDDLTDNGPWSLLLHCGYCFGIWAAAFVVAWGYLCDWSGGWGTAWWLFNGGMAVAYLGAIVMAYDGDDD